MARLALPVLALLLSACSGGGAETTLTSSSPVTTTRSAPSTVPAPTVEPATTTTTTAAAPVVPTLLDGFRVQHISIDGAALFVAVADTSDLRRQGLMNVEDLGDLDGMLFVFEQDTSGGFWMKDTLLPLDIAFFAADGAFVDGFEMQPCTTEDCPTYTPGGMYRYALELPLGEMPEQVQLLDVGR